MVIPAGYEDVKW